MTTEQIRSNWFLLPEIASTLKEAEPVDDATLSSIRVLSDDGPNTGVSPRLSESSWLREPPGPVVVSPVVEPKEFTEAVFCGDSVRIVRWVA